MNTNPGAGGLNPPSYDGRVAVEEAARSNSAVYAAAALSLAAAMIHLWAVPEHFLMWLGYGTFFIIAALVQGLYAVVLLRCPGRGLLLAGIGANLSIVVLYVLTRTAGIPFGPHAGKVEDAGQLDMAATAAEFGLVFALVTLLDGASRRWTINLLLLLGAAIWGLRLAGVLS